jgi:histone deacetylase 8
MWPIVERVKSIFCPDYIILQCGVDGLAGDPCATFNWCLDREIEGSMGWCIERVMKEWEGKKLVLGGGNVSIEIFEVKFSRVVL